MALSDKSSTTGTRPWDAVRRELRTLQGNLDHNLSRLNKLSAQDPVASHDDRLSAGNNAASSARYLETELDQQLTQFHTLVDRMAQIQEEGETHGSQVTMLHTLQRSRDLLYDYTRDIQQAKQNYARRRQRLDLLAGGGSHGDPNGQLSRNGRGETSNAVQQFLHERDRIDSSHHMIEMTLDQAYAVRSDLADQRRHLVTSTSRLGSLARK
ncbi:protein transport protein gos1 [Dimargaris verticillata]|uniref:Protein transport protein gos1 n=1 Tax=Dimargaris verticillata TaxID=2761393 RepID=A0A9W8EDI5_9FUNG|nr:protein transport protein gos1 [Dimargaris verticillata]